MIGTYADTLLSIHPHTSACRSVQFDGHRLVSGGYDGKVVGWDVEESKEAFCLNTTKGMESVKE